MTDVSHFPDRPHPLGLIDNPEWEGALTKRAELYLAERARRKEEDREPTSTSPAALIIIGGLLAFCCFGWMAGMVIG